MIVMRVGIVFDSFFALAKAVTIATRYSVVRRQTQNRPGCVQVVLYLVTYCVQ